MNVRLDTITLTFYADLNIQNSTDFESIIEVAAVQSGSKLYDELYEKYYDYENSNLARGIAFSKIFLPGNLNEQYMQRQYLWQHVQEKARQNNTDICIARDIRAIFPQDLSNKEMRTISESFITDKLLTKGCVVDANIHLHRKEIPHCHFLLPTLNLADNHYLDDIINGDFLSELENEWKEYLLNNRKDDVRS